MENIFVRKKRFFLFLFYIIIGIIILNVDKSNAMEIEKYSENDALKISITTIKSKSSNYVINEPIWVVFEILNISNQPLQINKRFIVGVELSFDIIKPSGKKAVMMYDIYMPPGEKDTILELLPGKRYLVNCNIAYTYTIDEIGKYTITAIYNPYTKSELELKVWSGEIKSNTIEFIIRK